MNEAAVEDAIRTHSSFNVIHRESLIKVDLFVLSNGSLDREQMRTRRLLWVDEPAKRELYFTSPEVLVLRKLDWFRQSGEVSKRQFLDAVAILKVQGDSLDRPYLSEWAAKFGLQELLQRASLAAGQ